MRSDAHDEQGRQHRRRHLADACLGQDDGLPVERAQPGRKGAAQRRRARAEQVAPQRGQLLGERGNDRQRVGHLLIVTKLRRAVPIAPRIERTYRVRFDEAGADGHLRSSGFLRFAQDLAWIHSENAGFGRDWYGSRGLTWLVRSVELEIVGALEYGSEVTVSTEVIGFRRVWARRRSEFHEAAYERSVAVALTDWVLLNARGIPVRPPQEIAVAFSNSVGDFTPLRLDLPPAKDVGRLEFSARRSEVDPMGHVNNAVYLDYIDEHLAATGRRSAVRHVPRRYQGEFLAAAAPEMAMHGEGWLADGSWNYRLSSGDRELFRARFASADANWVGG
jgi:acyl-ACP thioesterase